MPAWLGTATTAYLGVVTLRMAAANDQLLTITVSVVALAMALVHVLRERDDSPVAAAISGALAALAGGWALTLWGDWFGER